MNNQEYVILAHICCVTDGKVIKILIFVNIVNKLNIIQKAFYPFITADIKIMILNIH
jgi:hypothetical protein